MNLAKWPNKGSIIEALEGKTNIIKLAHECRTKPNALVLPPFDQVFPGDEDPHYSKPIIKTILMMKNKKGEISNQVRSIILDAHWRNGVWGFIDHMGFISDETKNAVADENMISLVTELQAAFVFRLEHLINTRVKFTKKNIGFGTLCKII